MTSRNCIFIFLVSLLVFGVFNPLATVSELSLSFYGTSCPQAEEIVRNMTWISVKARPALAAKLLRLHFHDCFVRGCDASILLDTVNNNTKAEKDAIPNRSLDGFDLIDEIKTEIENQCPGVVSCADIVALAARDSVSFLPCLDSDSIPRCNPGWPVVTGRRDGNISLASEVFGNIPSPFSNFSTLLQIFNNKNLDVNDLVVLSGGHTIGVAHCGTFSNRLYNFTGKGDADPSLNSTYAETLRAECPNPANPNTTVELDPGSSLSFDKHYYEILLQDEGLLQSDAALLTDTRSEIIVTTLRNSTALFLIEFAKSMVKMGDIQVLTGSDGEIRKQCRVVNSK